MLDREERGRSPRPYPFNPPDRPYEIHPYIMGLHWPSRKRKLKFRPEIAEKVAQKLTEITGKGYKVQKDGQIDLKLPQNYIAPRIERYLWGSEKQRRDLLCGILDQSPINWLKMGGKIEFDAGIYQIRVGNMVRTVPFLLRSLGIKTGVKTAFMWDRRKRKNVHMFRIVAHTEQQVSSNEPTLHKTLVRFRRFTVSRYEVINSETEVLRIVTKTGTLQVGPKFFSLKEKKHES
jgi:hypothetical protein